MTERSADKMVQILLKDPTRLEEIRKDPQKAPEVLNKTADEAKGPVPDTIVYRMMVGFLGGVTFAAIVGAIIIGVIGTNTPEILIAIGSAAVGALAGALVPTSKG